MALASDLRFPLNDLTGLVAATGNCKFVQEVFIFVSFYVRGHKLHRLNALWHPVLLPEQIHLSSSSLSSHEQTASMFEPLFRGFFFVLQVKFI
jgi:hypothetical protein